jgi:PAS domain-containing protein
MTVLEGPVVRERVLLVDDDLQTQAILAGILSREDYRCTVARDVAQARAGLFEQFADSAPDAIVGVGRDGRIVLANARTAALFGYKPRSEGTGLGLTTAHGIVTEAGGSIQICSEPGIGTVVNAHLPASAMAPAGFRSERADGARPRGRGETVLVVEDEERVRLLTARILVKLLTRVRLALDDGR